MVALYDFREYFQLLFRSVATLCLLHAGTSFMSVFQCCLKRALAHGMKQVWPVFFFNKNNNA